jgi:4-carboxymuconolactone decarboxylase
MRYRIAFVAVACFIAGVVCTRALGAAQAPQAKPTTMRGTRFTPLTIDRLTPEQRTMVDHILAGPRTSLDGPFNVLLRSPMLGDHAQAFGAEARFNGLPIRISEVAILMTAQWWKSKFEWNAHKAIALQAGLPAAVIDAIHAGRRPASMTPEEAAVYNFTSELREKKRVSDATYATALRLFGEKGVVDLIGTLGYYDLVEMVMDVDLYPRQTDQPDPFPDYR